MVEESQLSEVHQTLKDELGRAVLHELRHVVASGNTQASEDVVALARRIQLAWQEIASATKLHGGRRLHRKWMDLLEAKHRHLDKLSREVNQAERSFAWSKVLFTREEEYIRDVTMQALGATAISSPSVDPIGDDIFDDVEYQENVSIMTRIACRLKEEEDLVALRQAHVRERKLLRERLREAQQARIDARSRRKTELSKLVDWFQGAGVPISQDDLSPEIFGGNHAIEEPGGAGDDGAQEVRSPRRRHLSPMKATGPRLETGRRVRYWDKPVSTSQHRQDDFFTPLENTRTSMAHAAKMYDASGATCSSARERRIQPPQAASARSWPLTTYRAQVSTLPERPKVKAPSMQKHQPKHPIQHAASGPDAKQLLLLESSHHVVSEGARDGALVFWLEPKHGNNQSEPLK